MSYTPQRNTEIRRSIELLTKVTQNDQLKEPASMNEAQRQFQSLRDEMSKTEHPALVLLASIGERLAGHMYNDATLTGDDMRKFVTEIAEHITKDIAFQADPKPPAGKVTLKATADLRLSVRDGQRLGELLVQMTMLTTEQVEEAVRVQRATGQRLGEALLQLRLLTPDMLESALRVQKTKRAAAAKGDNWSTHKPGP